RVDLVRNTRGRVQLTKTWRICFMPQPTRTIALKEYEGILTGHRRDVDFWDWFMLFMLLGFGLIPGVIWWFYAIHKDSYYVALTRDHGFPDLMLYRGWNQARVLEIATTLRDATGMPCSGG